LPIPVPLVLGHEGVGRVEVLGKGAERDAVGVPLAVGDLVVWGSSIACGTCFYCRDAQEPTLCERRRIYGITRALAQAPHLTGSWAEKIHLEPGTTLVRLDDQTPPEAVISLGCAGPTVVHGLLHVAPVRPGESVVVQGAGPVGLAAAMYAHLSGAGRVIVIGAPRERLELAAQLGVGDELLDIELLEPPERLERVSELTAGRGADLVVECAGVPAAVSEALDLVRPGGRVLVLGQYTDHGPAPLNPHLITRKQLAVLGSWAFSAAHYVEYVRTLPQLRKRFAIERLLTTFPLERAEDAIDAARRGRVGKAVIVP
jgi:threonine dehydrogenase-like Zn-dependent dehydrogenase